MRGRRELGSLPDLAERWPAVLAAERVRRADRLARLADNPQAQRAELLRCSSNPLHWMRNYAWLREPRSTDAAERSAFPLILWPRQKAFVGWMMHCYRVGIKRATVNKARSTGASWLGMAWLTWGLLFLPGFTAKVGSRKEDLVDDGTDDSLLGKVRFILAHLPAWMLPAFKDHYLKLENPSIGSRITGESTNAGFARGARGGVVFLDEWAHVRPIQRQTAISRSLETVARTVFEVSTPHGRGDAFHRAWEAEPSSQRSRFALGWRSDPRKTEAWYESLLRINGGPLSRDEREQEHGLSFSAVTGHRIIHLDPSHLYSTGDLPPESREHWLQVIGMDFGSGPSLTVAVGILVEPSTPQRLWVDWCMAWSRTEAVEIARQARRLVKSSYGQHLVIVGDPAGKAAESDQESWITRLQSAGMPIDALPAEYNGALIDIILQEAQDLLDAGRLRINRDTVGPESPGAAILVAALEQWQWDVPEGVPLDLLSRAMIKPRKDAYSHPGDAFRYAVGHALRLRQQASDLATVTGGKPLTVGESVAAVYDRMSGST